MLFGSNGRLVFSDRGRPFTIKNFGMKMEFTPYITQTVLVEWL